MNKTTKRKQTSSLGSYSVKIEQSSRKKRRKPGVRYDKQSKAAVQGRRVGIKRKDMRWEADGQIWASRFEYEVYAALKEQGYDVRKTEPERDQLRYAVKLPKAHCLQCGAVGCAQEHGYTPDLYLSTGGTTSDSEGEDIFSPLERPGYYIEAKGYLRADKRSLLRAFRKARPDVNLRLVVQRDYKVGKGSLVSWARKYLKIPVHVWDGHIPEDW